MIRLFPFPAGFSPEQAVELGDPKTPDTSSALDADGKSGPSWRQFRPALVALLCGLTAIALVKPTAGQEERRTRVPVVGKVAGGATREAFTGNVQSLALERKLLKVNTVEGNVTEIFPVKKSVSVSMPTGQRIKLGELKAGMSVLIYYEQRKDKRRVTEIVVLASSPEQEKKKSPPPSSFLLRNGAGTLASR